MKARWLVAVAYITLLLAVEAQTPPPVLVALQPPPPWVNGGVPGPPDAVPEVPPPNVRQSSLPVLTALQPPPPWINGGVPDPPDAVPVSPPVAQQGQPPLSVSNLPPVAGSPRPFAAANPPPVPLLGELDLSPPVGAVPGTTILGPPPPTSLQQTSSVHSPPTTLLPPPPPTASLPPPPPPPAGPHTLQHVRSPPPPHVQPILLPDFLDDSMPPPPLQLPSPLLRRPPPPSPTATSKVPWATTGGQLPDGVLRLFLCLLQSSDCHPFISTCCDSPCRPVREHQSWPACWPPAASRRRQSSWAQLFPICTHDHPPNVLSSMQARTSAKRCRARQACALWRGNTSVVSSAGQQVKGSWLSFCR